MEGAYEQLNPVTLLKACVRRWKCFLVSFLLIGLLLGAWYGYSRWVNPVYSTTSVILLRPEKTAAESGDESSGSAWAETRSNRKAADGEVSAEESEEEKLLLEDLWTLTSGAGAYVDLIKNRQLVSKIVEDMGLEAKEVEGFYNSISVTNITSSPYMKISVTYGDPELSYTINNKIIEWLPEVLDEFFISADVLVIEAPVKPQRSSMPSMTMLVFLELAAGLLLGLLFVLVREIFYTTFRNKQDVERVLGLRNIGFFPKEGIKRSQRKKRQYDKVMEYTAANLISYEPKVVAFVADKEIPSADNYFDLAENLTNLGFKIVFFDFMKESQPMRHANYDYISVTDLAVKAQEEGSGKLKAVLKTEIEQSAQIYDIVLLGPFPYGGESRVLNYYDNADLLILLLEHNVTKQQRAKEILEGINRTDEHETCTVFTNVSWKRSFFTPYKEFMKEIF